MRWIIALPLSLVLAGSGCTTARVDDRVAFWRAETEHFLPKGTSQQRAIDFFHARKLELACCVRVPPQKPSYFALERNVGQMLWTKYDVAILVDFSPTGKVQDVRVQRWGVGP